MITIDEVKTILAQNKIPHKGKLRHFRQWVQITTEHLDSHNDYIQIYVTRTNEHNNNNRYLLDHDETRRYRFTSVADFDHNFRELIEEVKNRAVA